MNKYIIFGVIILTVSLFYYFSAVNKNVPVSSKNPVNYLNKDYFTYTVLLAEDKLDQAQDKGEVSKEKFIEVFETFPWDDQIKKANEIGVQSPTLSIQDNFQKKSFVISMAGDLDDTLIEKGYILLFIFKDENNQDMLYVKETESKIMVLDLINKFFEHNNFQENFLNVR